MEENIRDYIEEDSRPAALSATGNWSPVNEITASIYIEAILKVLCSITFFVPLNFKVEHMRFHHRGTEIRGIKS